MCCSVLQCVAVCCSVLYCVAVCCTALQCVVVRCSVLQCVAVRCSVLQGYFKEGSGYIGVCAQMCGLKYLRCRFSFRGLGLRCVGSGFGVWV